MENQIEKVNASDVFVDFLKELGSYADEQQIVSYLYTRSVKEAAEGRATEKESLQPQLSKLPEFTGDAEGRLNAIQELNAKKRNLLAKYDGKEIAFDADGFIEAAKNENLSYEQIERIIGEQLKVLKDNYAKNVEDERRDFQFHKLHPEFQKNPLPRVHENSDGALTTFFSKGEFGTILPTFRAKDKDSGEEIFYSNFHVESERPLSDRKEDEGKSVYTLSDGKRTVEMTDENFSRLTSPEIVRSFLNSLDESMQKQLEELEFDKEIHSDAFISRFGDWEKANRLENLKNSESLTKDDKIFSAGEDITKTVESLVENEDRKSIQSIEKELGKNIVGTYVNKDTGLSINVSNRNVTEISNHHYLQKEHIQAIQYIPEIIDKAIFIDDVENEDKQKHPNIQKYKYFAIGLNINGNDFTCKTVVGVDKSGNCYYDQSLSTIEKGKLVDLIQQKNKLENLSPLITQRESELSENESPSVYYDKRLINICQVPQMPYLEMKNGEWKPKKDAVQAVKKGMLSVEKNGQNYIMNDKTVQERRKTMENIEKIKKQEKNEKNEEQLQTDKKQREPLDENNSVQNKKDIEKATDEPSPQPETTEADIPAPQADEPLRTEHPLPVIEKTKEGQEYIAFGFGDNGTILPDFTMQIDGEEKEFKGFYIKESDGLKNFTITDGTKEFKMPKKVYDEISSVDYVRKFLDADKARIAPVPKDVFIGEDNPSYQSHEGEGWDKIGDDDYYDYLESPEGQARMLSESESIPQEQTVNTQVGKTGIFVNKLTSFLRDNPYASYEDYKDFYDKNYNLTPAKLETKVEFSNGKFNKTAIMDVNGHKSKQDATFVSTMRQTFSQMDREGWDYLSTQFSPDANKDSLESAKSALKEFKDNLNTQSLWQKEQENISTLNNLQAKYARYTENTGKEAWDSFREGLDIKENWDNENNVTVKLFDFSDETQYPPDDPLTPQKKQDALNALIGKELPKMNSGISVGNVYQGEILENYVIVGYDELGNVTEETESGPVTRKTYDYSTVVIEKIDEDGNTQTRHLPLRAIENALTVRTRAEKEAQQELTADDLEKNMEIKEDKLQAIKENFEDLLGIGQDELRLNTAANFMHNFIIRCNNEGFNTGECLQIAKESYSQLNDDEKKKFIQQKALYEKQHGEKYEYFLIREYKKNREPFTHTPSPFYPTSIVAPLYANEVREKKGTPVSVGSKVCVGDEFNMTLSYKSVFGDENNGKKNDKPIVVSQKFRVASTNPINNCVVLVSEDGKESHTIPCDTFLKKAEKAKEKQIKNMNKTEKKHAKEKKSEFSLSIG